MADEGSGAGRADPDGAAAGAGTAAVVMVSRQLRAPRAAGVAGLLFAVLYTVGLVLLRTSPVATADPSEMAEIARQGVDPALLIGTFYLVPFSAVAFLWFVAVARDQVDDREDRFFATVLVGSGVLFVGLLLVAAATASAVGLAIRYLGDPEPGVDVVRLIRAVTYSLLFVFASRAAAVFLISFSTIAAKRRVLPAWVSASGYVLGLALFIVVTLWEWVVLALPAWVAVVSVVILVRERGGAQRGAAVAAGEPPPG